MEKKKNEFKQGDKVDFTENDSIALENMLNTANGYTNTVSELIRLKEITNNAVFAIVRKMHPEFDGWEFTISQKDKQFILNYKS